MNKQSLLKIVNPVLLLSILLQFLSVILAKFGVDVYSLHEYNGYFFGFLLICHLYLNWGWIMANIKNKKK